MSNWRKSLLAIGFGVLVLVLLEAGLWIFHFSSAQCEFDPFVRFKENLKVLTEVDYHGQKLIGINPRLAAYFNPLAFGPAKSAGTRRIFVMGGSDAMGFPFGDQGAFSQFLSLGLNKLDPSRHYQVINLGAFGYASYRVLAVVKDALGFEPDLLIVMTGHNEFLEKRDYIPPGRFLRAQEKLSRLKIYCLVKTAVFKVVPLPSRPLIFPEVRWEHYSLDPKMRSSILAHFQFNVTEMARRANETKVPIMFLTSPANLKDFPPFHSEPEQNIGASELKELKNYEQELDGLASEKKYGEATAAARKIIELDPEAKNWYRLGQMLLASGNTPEAKSAFEFALAKDAWPVRALPEFNDFIRGLAPPTYVVDLVPVFAAQSQDGIPGDNLFYDHCHPTIEAQSLIAGQIIKSLGEKGWLSLPADEQAQYQSVARQYIDSLPKSFLAEGYYRLAVEIGINMGLKDMGKKYLDLGFSLEPDSPKLKKLAENLK